jgi:hypothetical protein
VWYNTWAIGQDGRRHVAVPRKAGREQ